MSRCIRFKIVHVIVAIAMLSGVLSTLVYFDAKTKEHRQVLGNEHSCQSNLNNIAIALMNYHQSFGGFPPPYATDGEQRIWSWRALILPWFGFDHTLAAGYDFNTPWDSEKNKRISKAAPPFYMCPAYRGRRPPQCTSYYMLNNFSNRNSKDIPRNAILVIEAANILHDWRSPFDDLNELQIRSITSVHPSGFGVILADFTRTRLKDTKKITKKGDFYIVDDAVVVGSGIPRVSPFER